MQYRDAFGRTNTWSEEDILHCVGSGWSDILRRLLRDLELLGWNGELHQVKEKYGGLRFYIGGGSDAIFDRIDEAESETYRTCEQCGKPGKLRGQGWVYTACDECDAIRAGANKREQEIADAEFRKPRRREGAGPEQGKGRR